MLSVFGNHSSLVVLPSPQHPVFQGFSTKKTCMVNRPYFLIHLDMQEGELGAIFCNREDTRHCDTSEVLRATACLPVVGLEAL